MAQADTSYQMSAAAIAVNRFGLGARPEQAMPTDPRQWLLAQLQAYQPRPAPWTSQPATRSLLLDYAQEQVEMRGQDDAAKQDARRMLRREVRDDYLGAVTARSLSALHSDTPFLERLVHFWANHFALSVEKPLVTRCAGAFEAEAIRPHVLGRFRDMLLAVEQHPAMLVYLDQVRSIGPNSQAASRAARQPAAQQRGLNENLAREILELHSVGVRSGYSQQDVTEFARALTGWSVVGQANADDARADTNGFLFRPQLHEPGPRSILGRRYTQSGQQQALAVLDDLAASPATATHLAGKLATHFTGDTPSAALVQRLAEAYRDSGGELSAMYRVLVAAPEAWTPAPAKFKTPWEWTVSLLRATGRDELRGLNMAQLCKQLGQPVWKPGSPAGYDDHAASWAAPDALVRRVELAQRLLAPLGDRLDARNLAERCLGTVSAQTASAIARADSVNSGLVLLFVSPEFLRR